jgi:hypothetical protein
VRFAVRIPSLEPSPPARITARVFMVASFLRTIRCKELVLFLFYA